MFSPKAGAPFDGEKVLETGGILRLQSSQFAGTLYRQPKVE
jgi:hypothetical protein